MDLGVSMGGHRRVFTIRTIHRKASMCTRFLDDGIRMLSASELPVHPLSYTEPLAFWTRRFVTPPSLSRSCIPLLLSQYSCSVSTVEVESMPSSYTDNTALLFFWVA